MKTRTKYSFIQFFKDVDGDLSAKRLLTLIFGLLFAIAIVANLFWGKKLDEPLVTALVELQIALVLGIASEKFTKRGVTSTEANDEKLLKDDGCVDCKN